MQLLVGEPGRASDRHRSIGRFPGDLSADSFLDRQVDLTSVPRGAQNPIERHLLNNDGRSSDSSPLIYEER